MLSLDSSVHHSTYVYQARVSAPHSQNCVAYTNHSALFEIDMGRRVRNPLYGQRRPLKSVCHNEIIEERCIFFPYFIFFVYNLLMINPLIVYIKASPSFAYHYHRLFQSFMSMNAGSGCASTWAPPSLGIRLVIGPPRKRIGPAG